MHIEADYQLERAELIQGLKASTPRVGRMVVVSGYVLVLLSLIGLASGGRGSVWWIIDLVLAVAAIALPTLVARRHAAISARTLLVPVHVEFTPESVSLITPHSRIQHQWTAFLKTAETDALFLLFIGPRTAVPVPKRALSTTDAVQLRAFLKDPGGPAAALPHRRGGRHH